jgi:phosphoribosyl-dephospho-CoA transferase
MTGPDPRPARHDLVWLRAGWQSALRAPAPATDLAVVDRWVGLGRPAVARRAEREDPDAIALGVALPPADGRRRRVALLVAPAAVARVAPPLRLADVVASAPAGWRPRLAALDAAARRAGLALGVYGSLACQHLAGEPYVSAASDVDLLVRPAGAAELRAALGLLLAHAAGPPALDGEVLLPGGFAVSWRELLTRPERVLVKSGAGAAIRPTREALGPLAEGLR